MHLAGLEIDKSRRPVRVVDDGLLAPACLVQAARHQSRRRSAARAKRAVRRPLPHGPDEPPVREAGLEGERRRPTRQLEADAPAGNLRRHGLHVRVADAEGDDRATAADDERDLARPAQRVGADPRTGRPGARAFSCQGTGARDQRQRNGDARDVSQRLS